MVGKWQLYTRINSRRSRDALNCYAPLGKRFEIKPNLESISGGAPRAADHPRRFGPFHHFPSPSPWGGHPSPPPPRAVRSRGVASGSAALRGRVSMSPYSHRTSAATLRHLAAAPPRGSICRHIWARSAPPRGHICRRRGAAPRRGGRSAVGAAPPPAGAGRAGAARRGATARWGGRPPAWPRSGCCCSWRWDTPGPTGRSRRTATGGCCGSEAAPVRFLRVHHLLFPTFLGYFFFS